MRVIKELLKWRTWREIIVVGLLRGGRGNRCPECNVKPLKAHTEECSIGKWDGGTWA